MLRSSCKSVLRLLLLPVAVFITAFFSLSTLVNAAQTVPYKINFQGRLTNASGTVLSGTYDMTFKLYTAVTGGTFIWGETRTAANSNAVTVTNGLFSILIGEGTASAGTSASLQAAVAANTTMYMEVTVGAETLSPRSQFGSSAYAINADMIDGIDGASLGQLSVANSWTAAQNISAASTAAFQVKNGSTNLLNVDSTNSIVTIGTSDTTGAVLVLDVKTGSGDPTGSSAVVGAMYYNSNSGKFRCYQGAAWTDCIATATLQTAYTASTGGTTPEIKVDATRGGLVVQDADTTIAGNLFSVTQTNASGLGTSVFSVGSTGAISLGLASTTTTLPGNISSTGTITATGTTMNFKPSSSSTTAFQVQNSSSVAFLSADTTNTRVQIGSSTTDANAVIFVVDSYNSGTDPTGVVGGMYYNTSTSKFRCYQNAAWADCIPTATLQGSYTASTGGTTPEIKVDATRGGINIQDADTTIAGTLFAVNQTNASGLGTSIFSVNSTGAVSLGIAGTTTTLPGNIASTGTAQFKPSSSNATAFEIEDDATTNTLLAADTANNRIQIGSSTTDTAQILFQLDSFDTYADTATCGTATNQGGLYYNTKTNAIRGCINGAWEDMVSTAALGLQLFGVVPDSGATPGDIYGVSSAIAGPCKVSVGANTTTVSWTACTAFSGGRKVIVAAGTATTTNSTANNFQHLCLTGTNGQPALSTTGAETANLSTVSFPSSTAPIVCLADIKFTSANNTITQVYDTRTYTTTDKTFVALNSAAGVGSIVIYIATKGTVQTVANANNSNIAGVVVASTGTASTTAINAIIATGGPAAVKAITGTNAINAYVFTSATAGYATTVATKPTESTSTIYNLLGNARTAWTGATACAINSDACAGSVMTDIDKR